MIVPCQYYSTFIYFLATFYTIFGTNILIQCPVPVPVCCMFFVSENTHIKRSPNVIKIYGELFWNICDFWELESPQTKAHTAHKTPGRARPPRHALVGCAQPSPPEVPIFWYISHLDLEKNKGGHSGWSAAVSRRNLGGTNLGFWWVCSAGETSLPKGEIIAIVITNAPLIVRGQSPSTSSSAPSHLKTLVHLLYPILVSKSGIGASRLLVVLITPCS